MQKVHRRPNAFESCSSAGARPGSTKHLCPRTNVERRDLDSSRNGPNGVNECERHCDHLAARRPSTPCTTKSNSNFRKPINAPIGRLKSDRLFNKIRTSKMLNLEFGVLFTSNVQAVRSNPNGERSSRRPTPKHPAKPRRAREPGNVRPRTSAAIKGIQRLTWLPKSAPSRSDFVSAENLAPSDNGRGGSSWLTSPGGDCLQVDQ